MHLAREPPRFYVLTLWLRRAVCLENIPAVAVASASLRFEVLCNEERGGKRLCEGVVVEEAQSCEFLKIIDSFR